MVECSQTLDSSSKQREICESNGKGLKQLSWNRNSIDKVTPFWVTNKATLRSTKFWALFLFIFSGIAVPLTFFFVEKCREIWLHKVTVGNAVNKFPGPPTKWLTGNLHLVKFIFLIFSLSLMKWNLSKATHLFHYIDLNDQTITSPW